MISFTWGRHDRPVKRQDTRQTQTIVAERMWGTHSHPSQQRGSRNLTGFRFFRCLRNLHRRWLSTCISSVSCVWARELDGECERWDWRDSIHFPLVCLVSLAKMKSEWGSPGDKHESDKRRRTGELRGIGRDSEKIARSLLSSLPAAGIFPLSCIKCPYGHEENETNSPKREGAFLNIHKLQQQSDGLVICSCRWAADVFCLFCLREKEDAMPAGHCENKTFSFLARASCRSWMTGVGEPFSLLLNWRAERRRNTQGERSAWMKWS